MGDRIRAHEDRSPAGGTGDDARGASAPALRWQVVPLHTPRVPRHCPGCESRRLYRSSDKFRVNAHHRKLDVWLVYLCEHCDNSLNVTIIERTNVKHIDHALLEAYMRNDVATAWRHAFDRPALERHGVRTEPDVQWELRADPGSGAGFSGGPGAGPSAGSSAEPSPEGEPIVVNVHMDYPVNVRLDRILAAGLGLSRSKIAGELLAGRLRVEPASLGKASRRVNAPFCLHVAAGVMPGE